MFMKEILFFISFMGPFNGIVFGLYMIVSKKIKTNTNYFFAIVMIAISLKNCSTILYTFDISTNRIILQIGALISLFIGPSLYFYNRNLINLKVKNWKIHYIPIIIFAIISLLFFPFKNYVFFWNEYLILMFYMHWFVYILVAGFDLFESFKTAKLNLILNAKSWSIYFFISNCMIFGVQILIFFSSQYYISGGIFYTVLFYLLLNLVSFQKKSKWSILYGKTFKYAGKKIISHKADEDMKRVYELMIKSKLFKDSKLKIKDLAILSNLPPHYLSRLINDEAGKSFALFVNEFRVEEATNMIKNKSKFSLEGIGYECGFNSKSNFYYYFKNIKGTTPTEYFKRNKCIPEL